MTKHAVLTDTHVVTIAEYERKLQYAPLRQDVTHVSDLWHVGVDMGVSHFWIMPGCKFDALGYDVLEEREGFNIFYSLQANGERNEKPVAGRCRKDGRGTEVFFCYPTHGSFRWQVNTPLDILSAVDYLTKVLDVTIAWSPAHLGKKLLQKIHSNDKHLDWVRESTVPMDTIPFMRASRDIQFYQPLTLDMVGQYLHHYDKNSAYLSACQGVKVGCGEPVYVETRSQTDCNHDCSKYVFPGIYHVNVLSTSWPASLPPIINTEWVTLDVLQFALANGYKLQVSEAYLFNESHQLLRKWAGDLWKIRMSLKDENSTEFRYAPGRLNAYTTIKEIALVSVGGFAMKKEHTFMRPNWWADIVGKARANFLYNLKKYHAQGYKPQFIYVDAVYYVSPDSSPAMAVPGILDRSGELGGFKHEYSLLLTEEIINHSLTLKKQALLAYLKEQAEKER